MSEMQVGATHADHTLKVRSEPSASAQFNHVKTKVRSETRLC